jgi:hypothetical protein
MSPKAKRYLTDLNRFLFSTEDSGSSYFTVA